MSGKRYSRILWLISGALTAALAPNFAHAQSSRLCAGCHKAIWETWQKTGMGRSFYRPLPENLVENFTRDTTFFHIPSATYFTMLRHDGKLFQRGYQLNAAGSQINITEKQIDYIMGSGNHARTYLTLTPANTLVELPLGWYFEKGGYFAMNPGYDRPNHDGFRRPVTYDCMFCHNAYPKRPAGHEGPLAEPVYAAPLPEGIDCQRCHGSGTRHMQVAGTAGAKREEIRSSIVNPARLTPERQLEGCMVCHLETTSSPLPNALQRVERPAFSYKPGEPLGGFIINFDHAPDEVSQGAAGRQDKFEIASAAYRLRRSACFLKSAGKMTCTTCHNPHDVPRGEQAIRHYTAVCRQCHAQAFNALVQTGKHTAATGCLDCHMPKRRTADVIHAAVTDHLIQRQRPSGDPLAERTELPDSYRGRVALYYPESLPKTAENELTLAVAQVIQESNLTEGIAQLTAAIHKYQPRRPEYYLYLADALQSNNQLAKAVPVYREAVRRNPGSAVVLQKLGTALRRAANYPESADLLKRATLLEPARSVTWHELGLTWLAMGRNNEAISAIGKALQLDPDFPEAHNNLGNILLAAGQEAQAESAFRAAIRNRTNYADAHGNLASLLSGTGRLPEAKEEFEIALRLRPIDALARYNYGILLGRTSRFDEARHEFEEALRTNPDFTDAHLLLGDLLMATQRTQDAAPHYREALRIAPDSSRAHLGLAAALLATGDRANAIAHLRSAAAGTDPAIRSQAEDILKQLQENR